MENFAICSKVLYNEDLLQKRKQIELLSDPQIVLTCKDEFTEFIFTFFNNINNAIKEQLNSDFVTFINSVCIFNLDKIETVLNNDLNKFTDNNINWVNKTVKLLSDSIKGMLYGLKTAVFFENSTMQYASLDNEDFVTMQIMSKSENIKSMMYTQFTYLLHNYDPLYCSYNGILDKIVVYQCSKCNRTVPFESFNDNDTLIDRVMVCCDCYYK
jgi:hypothetical protein